MFKIPIEHRYTAYRIGLVFLASSLLEQLVDTSDRAVRESADCLREVLDLQGSVHALLLQTRCRRAVAACPACRSSRNSAGLRNSFSMPPATGASRSAPGSWVCCPAGGRSELCKRVVLCKVKEGQAASFGNLETPNQPGCLC